MNREQKVRLSRLETESFYLVSLQDQITTRNQEKETKFIVTGATSNLYTVTLNHSRSKIKSMDTIINCNCNDAKGIARIMHIKCKHVCFVWIRILKLPAEYLGYRLFGRDELNYIKRLIDPENIKIEYCLKNQQLTKKYYERILDQNQQFKPTLAKQKDADSCPICMDSLKIGQTLACPECKNLVHQSCVRNWLANSIKQSCIYCRASWEALKLELTKSIVNKPPKYANLGSYIKYNSLGSESSTEES